MSGSQHLVGVWNPSYAADAMSATVARLLRRVREHRQGELDEDDVYVWWGKVKSSNRQSPEMSVSRHKRRWADGSPAEQSAVRLHS